MELPVYENQVPVGTLRIRTQGLYTLFETRLPPREEGRFLRRRLTRLQLMSLPPRIDTVLVTANAEAPPPEAAAPRPPLPKGGCPEGAGGFSSSPAWTRLPDGSLLDPARRLLALPCAPGAAPENVRKITLDGREYWLFRT